MARRQPPTIRRQLMRVVIAAALPVWLGSALLLYQVHVRERALDERNASATARALMVAVDRDLASARTAAEILATSPSLLSGDLATFYGRATTALRSNIGDNVVLSDASGQQLLNTVRPYGEKLPRHGSPELLRKVFETGKTAVSDVYLGGALERPVVSVDTPVFLAGEVVYDLAVGLFPERLGEILREQELPEGWVASIFDSKGIIVARTHAPGRFVGQKGSPALVERMDQVSEGMVQTDTLEGIPVSSLFSRSQVSNWAVAIGVPTAELTARLWHSLAVSVAITLVLMALGIAAAQFLAERLARPIRALMGPALAHGRGERIEVPPLDLEEADGLRRALVEGSRLLDQRTAERDRAEWARQQSLTAKEAAEQAARARSAYFAYLSHELRTPLTAILGYSELIATRARSGDPKSLGYCARIEQGVRHLLTVVNDILDYAKFEAHELVLQKQPVDVADEVLNVVGLLAANAERAGVELRPEVAPNLPALLADPTRLRQILINLLSNAVRFTRRGGAVTISVTRPADGQLVIEVRDEGIGIPAEDLSRVVQPFAQVVDPSTHKREGTGLGLPLTKGLVELHGGSFEIASELRVGTTVTIRLPVAGAAVVEGEFGESVTEGEPARAADAR